MRTVVLGLSADARRWREGIAFLIRSAAPLLALGEALLRCWAVLALVVLAPAVLAMTGQGRQALYVTGDALETNFGAFALAMLSAILAAVYAQLVLDTARSRVRPRAAWSYARHCAPLLIAATAGFALSLLLRYGAGLDFVRSTDGGVNFLFLMLSLAPVAAVVLATLINDDRTGHLDRTMQPMIVVVPVYLLALLFTDANAVFLRYAALMAGILAGTAFFSDSYTLTAGPRRALLKVAAWVCVIYCVAIIALAWHIAVDPVAAAPWWSPMGTIVIAMLAWLCLGFLLDWLLWLAAQRTLLRRNPLVLTAVRMAVIGFVAWRLLTGAFGDTELKALAVDQSTPQQTQSAYLDRWLAERSKHATPQQPYPVFIVTAEGGGIRAAYWTATTLAALHDHPEFSKHVLALSGVSGGSVGASLYAALAEPAVAPARPDCWQAGRALACARALGRSDLLSAPVAAMLLSEPFNRITARIQGADRAAALDRSLERAWKTVMGDERLAAPFGTLAAGSMLVLPNSTHAGDGRRLVISAVAMELPDARVVDGRTFPASTATLLSARFPGLSPAAIHPVQVDGKRSVLRIIDGGYADNSGAATGADVLAALMQALERNRMRDRFVPTVIAIANGSDVVTEAPSLISKVRSMTLGTLLDPVLTLDSVRSNVSRDYANRLCAQVTAARGHYFALQLRHGDADLPLGWMLAATTADVMDARLEELHDASEGDYAGLRAVLNGQKPRASGRACGAPARPEGA